MEIYLRQASDIIRFPIIPASISVDNSAIIETKNIIKRGEISTFGGRKLRKISLSSFFPNQVYSFCSYTKIAKPYVFVTKLKKWIDAGHILRLIITDTDINFECTIAGFTYTEQDSTGDVYFDLDLLEYIRIEIPKYTTSSSGSNKPRPTPPPTTYKTHTVKKGDCLSEIAKKYYGKGSLYPRLKEKNKKKYPSLAKNNVIKVGWVLVI